MKIGVIDCGRFKDYADWLSQSSMDLQIVRLSGNLKNDRAMDDCDGLLLTGGEDIDPSRYGKEPGTTGKVNLERDAFEFQVIDSCLKEKKPILGICRGLQIMNVFLGGTLIVDLPSIGINSHGRSVDGEQHHVITVERDSLLFNISGEAEGTVNSAHHQAVDKLGGDLRPIAWSSEKVIESIEWRVSSARAWMLLVQWHPERLSDNVHFSQNIRDSFLQNCSR